MHQNLDFSGLRFNADGLIPAIIQEAGEDAVGRPVGRVLMMATGQMHYWSRSRKKLWRKGESSGHSQEVVSWYRDCDGDTLLFTIRQHGGACHTGYESCFFQPLEQDGRPGPVNETPIFDPDAVYGEASHV
jgi:phosphoribosyl-AMP cyclohydrolase